MATAQQLFVDQFVKEINGDPNLAARVIASSPSTGLLRVTTRTTSDPRASYLAGGSSVTGAGTFASKPVTGSPKYVELYFSWTLAPGDTVKINAGDNFQSLDLTYNLPLNTTVDAGGLDHTTIGGGAGGGTGGGSGGVAIGGSGIGSAQHRRMVVMECGSASSSFGSMFALDPQDATGISIPTFRVVTSLPSAGSSMGESVYVTATRQGYVWDGTAWRDITASPIRSFPNDALLQADTTEQVGTYAVASDTGNMYVKTAVDGWRRIGIAEFSTYSDLNSWDAAIGTEAISRDLDVLLTAVASDTGKRFVNNGTRWVQDPIEHYATETALLAATAIDGHLAWADDTNVVFTASGGTWHRLQGPQITVGTTAPSAPGTGDQWFDQRDKQNLMKVWDGKAWKETSGASVGTTGAMVKLPGYFNEDPSLTATSDDEGGLAFKYNGSQKQLWLYKNGPGWGAITPMMGNPANVGKTIVADANGYATWGGWNMESTKWLDSISSGATGSWTQTLDTRPQRYLKWDMTGSCTTQNCRLMLIMQQNGGWWNWSTSLAEAQAMTSFESGGLREELSSIKSGWWNSSAGGIITEDNSNYTIKANSTWFCKGTIIFSSDRATLIADTSYTSDNNTPMRCIFRARWSQDMRQCNSFGLKYPNGTGWFVGHVKYQ